MPPSRRFTQTRDSVGRREQPMAPDVHDQRIGEDSPVKEHTLPALRDIRVRVYDDQRLRLQASCKGGRGSQNDLTSNRDPSCHISQGGSDR